VTFSGKISSLYLLSCDITISIQFSFASKNIVRVTSYLHRHTRNGNECLNKLQSRCSISKSVLPSRVYVITDFHRLHFCRCYCVHVSFINSYSLVVLSCRCRTERNAKPNNVTQRERIGRAIVLGAARPVL
jgi:hypothetical protein